MSEQKTASIPALTSVESSNLDAVGIDKKTKTLFIRFKGGGTFSYTGDKAEQHYTDLMAAQSKGKYFQSIRKDKSLVVTKVSGA